MKKRLYPIEVLSVYGQVFTKKELSILHKSHYVLGGKAILAQVFPQYEDETLYKGKVFQTIGSPIEKNYQFIEAARAQGKRVLVLADGDALYFGIGASLIQKFGTKAIHIHAGISIVQRLCAKVGLAWHNVQHISLHGRDTLVHWQALCVAIYARKPVCVLTDAKAKPKLIAQYLLERGAKDLILYIAENLGQQNEHLHKLTLLQAAKNTRTISDCCTILILPSTATPNPTLGIEQKDVLHENGLMTKNAIRATALSLLKIEPQHTLWDIGSGSGSVAIEMCTLAHTGQVIAIEKNSERIKQIKKNRRNFGAIILDICEGHAPQCLNALPKPHGIFVGGGLSQNNAEELLTYLIDALPQGGRLVISCVLLGTLQRVQDFFKNHTWPIQILHLAINNATPLAQDIRFVPENPVFLISIHKIVNACIDPPTQSR